MIRCELRKRNLEVLKVDGAILFRTHRDAGGKLAVGVFDFTLELTKLRIIVVAEDRKEPRAQIERAYLLALARRPSEDEIRSAQSSFELMATAWNKQLEKEQPAEPMRTRSRWLALATLCHTLINSAEFLYID